MEATTTALTVPQNVPAKIAAEINQEMPTLSDLLPRDIPFKHFIAGVWGQFSLQRDLAKATPTSIARALHKAATKGLLPGRDCCILPFNRRPKNGAAYVEATMVEEVQGLLRRLDRTGRVIWAKAEAVFERDTFVCDELAEIYEFRRCISGNRGKLICYFSAFRLKDYDKPLVRVCTLEEVEEVKTKMARGEQEAWIKWPQEMGKKTALKKHAKMLNLIEDDDDEEPRHVTEEQFKASVTNLFGDREEKKEEPEDVSVIDLDTFEDVTDDEPLPLEVQNSDDQESREASPEDKAEIFVEELKACVAKAIEERKLSYSAVVVATYVEMQYNTAIRKLPLSAQAKVLGWFDADESIEWLRQELDKNAKAIRQRMEEKRRQHAEAVAAPV